MPKEKLDALGEFAAANFTNRVNEAMGTELEP